MSGDKGGIGYRSEPRRFVQMLRGYGDYTAASLLSVVKTGMPLFLASVCLFAQASI